jgi:hypothetical protein
LIYLFIYLLDYLIYVFIYFSCMVTERAIISLNTTKKLPCEAQGQLGWNKKDGFLQVWVSCRGHSYMADHAITTICQRCGCNGSPGGIEKIYSICCLETDSSVTVARDLFSLLLGNW